MEIKLKKQQAEFLRMCGSCVKTGNDDVFYYMPFWWKQVDDKDNIFEMLSFDSLPDELKKAINDFHENGITAVSHTINTYIGKPVLVDVCLEQKDFNVEP